MSSVTLHFCDFNPHVPEHQADFHVVPNTNGDDKPKFGESFDVCAAHFTQAVFDKFNGGTTEVKVVRVGRNKVALKIEEPPKTKVICPRCNKSTTNLASHNWRHHRNEPVLREGEA